MTACVLPRATVRARSLLQVLADYSGNKAASAWQLQRIAEYATYLLFLANAGSNVAHRTRGTCAMRAVEFCQRRQNSGVCKADCSEFLWGLRAAGFLSLNCDRTLTQEKET
jgi:hypothetical protein